MQNFIDKLIKKPEAADMLSCSVRHVERLVRSRVLPKVMVLGAVRFRLSDVLALIKKGAA